MIEAVVLASALAASESDGPRVIHWPGHPAADVAGNVAVIGRSASGSPLEVGGNPPLMPGWPLSFAGSAPLEGAVAAQLDGDPGLEIAFIANKTVYLVNADGTQLPGWPKAVPFGSRAAGNVALGDLDGDGDLEVVACSDNWPNGSFAWTHAWHLDGTGVSGFPVNSFGDHARSPTVSDLDGDGSAEIIVGERDWPLGAVYVFGGDGSLLPGWPQAIDHVPASSAGAADLDGDGTREIVYESFTSIYAFQIDGTIVPGFPVTPTTGDVFSYSAPTFADVDDDGLPEIAIGGHVSAGTSHVFLLDGDGSDMPGWPRPVTYWVYAPVSFVDLDGDEDLELVVGDQVLSGSPADRVYAWHHDGSTVSGWPVGPIWAINAQATAADLDGDGDPELVWDDNTQTAGEGRLLGYHHDGTAIAGWPLTTAGSTFFNTTALGDTDGDGDLELWAAGHDLNTNVNTIYLWDLPDAPAEQTVAVGMFQYGPGRDGRLPDAPCPGDLDGNGTVATADLLMLLGVWGPCPGCPEDLDGNGTVSTADLLILLGAWGPCP